MVIYSLFPYNEGKSIKEGAFMQKIGKLKTYTSKEIESSCVSIGFECLDRELFDANKCYDPLAKTGVKHARVQTGWAKCEKEKGIYDFAWLDDVVDNLLSRGIFPWFNVGYGNPVYMPDVPNPTAVGCVPLYYGDECLNAWKSFVRALTEHYRDRVSHYEIWNEADGKSFWYPSTANPEEYALLVNLTAEVILSVYPDAKIGANVSAPYYFDYTDRFYASVDKDKLHFFAYHAYSAMPEYRFKGLIHHHRKSLDANGLAHVDLWQGEGGYPSWAYEGHWLVKAGCDDERGQAVFQLRRYFLDICYGAKRSSFFQMADMWEKPYAKAVQVLKKPAAHGILNGLTYTPKASYTTITHLSTIFSGEINADKHYMHINTTAPSPMETLACQMLTYSRNGKPVYAYYLPTDLAKNEEIPYTADVCIHGALKDAVLIDPYTGEVFSLDAPTPDSPYDPGIVAYKNLPLKDYPLMVTDKDTYEIV